MITLEFSVTIKASPSVIWFCLWDDQHYRTWTKVFTEGSFYKTESFTEGSRIHLLDGKGGGMYSDIARLIPNQYIAFKHIGQVSDNQEMALDEESKQWSGAIESYELVPEGDFTRLIAKVETFDVYIDSMKRSFPPALEAVKNLAESV